MAKKPANDQVQNDISFFGGPTVNVGADLSALLMDFYPERANEMPVLLGDSGIGKTESIYQLADALSKKHGVTFTAKVLDLANMEPQDFLGIYYFAEVNEGNKKYKVSRLATPDFLPKPNENVILVFDELNRASKDLANGIMRFCKDKRIGEYVLPDSCMLIGAANIGEQYNVIAMTDPAWISRLAFMQVKTDVPLFLKYFKTCPNFNELVYSYLSAKPGEFYNHENKKQGMLFATPRAWEQIAAYLNRRIKAGEPLDNPEVYKRISSKISASSASVFCDFLAKNIDMVNLDTVLYDYDSIRERVRNLRKSSSISVLSDLTKAVAVAMVERGAEDDELKRMSKHVGKFLTDLPDEKLMSFLQEFHGKSKENQKFQLKVMRTLAENQPELTAKMVEMTKKLNSKD